QSVQKVLERIQVVIDSLSSLRLLSGARPFTKLPYSFLARSYATAHYTMLWIWLLHASSLVQDCTVDSKWVSLSSISRYFKQGGYDHCLLHIPKEYLYISYALMKPNARSAPLGPALPVVDYNMLPSTQLDF